MGWSGFMFFPLANDKKAPATPRRLSVGRGMAEAKFAERHGAASSALSTLHEAVVRQGRTVNHSRANNLMLAEMTALDTLVIINLGALNWANSALGVRGNARDLAGHLIAGQSCHPACRRCLRERYRRMAALRGVSTAAQAFPTLNGVGARRISPTKEAPAIERRG